MATGSIKEIDKNLFMIRYDAPRDKYGKRRQKTERFHGSQKEAQARLRECLREIDVGDYIEPTNLTLDKYLVQWFASKKYELRPNVAESYIKEIELHINPKIGHIKLQDLSPLTIKTFYTEMLEKGRTDGCGGLSTRTVRYMDMILKQALAEAVTLGLIRRSPIERVKPPRLIQKEMRIMTEQEISTFLAIIKDSRYEVFFRLALGTGLRRGEMLALRWKDIDFAKGTVRVERTLVKVRGGVLFQPPKTQASQRTISLPPSVIELLQNQRNKQKFNGDNDLVFCTKNGSPIYPNNLLKRHFKKLLNRAGLSTEIRLHDLRHTWATYLLSKGVNLKIIAEYLGHTNPSFTMRVYGHIIPSMHESVIKTTESMLETCDQACDQNIT